MTPKRNFRYGGQFTLLFHSQLIQPNYPNTPHRRSTTFFVETIFSLSQASFSVLYILLSSKAVNKELLYAFRKFHWIQDVGLYPLEDITVCSTFPFAIKRISSIVKTPSKSKTSRGNILNQCFVEETAFKNNQSYLSFVNHLKDMRGKYHMHLVTHLMQMFEIEPDSFVHTG